MSAAAASVVEVVRPRVWVGCLGCYNAGRLVGRWVDAEDAADLSPEDVRAIGHLVLFLSRILVGVVGETGVLSWSASTARSDRMCW